MAAAHDDVVRRPALVLALSTAVAALVVTLAVVVLPFFQVAYRAPALHVMLETINAVVAVLVMYLVYGRLRQEHRLQDLLLMLALGTIAVANLVLTAVPDALTPGRAADLDQWGPLTVRLVGTVLFVAAALTRRTTEVSRRTARATTGGVALLLAALGVAGALWGHQLPAAVDPLTMGDGTRPALAAHPVVLSVHLSGVVLYAAAAVALVRQADRTRDELLRWLAAGCVLASFSRVHYVLFPSLYSDYVYTGDLLRLGFYAFMFVGAAREITSFWEARAQSAVLEDRRRIARDLHDGLIQELSYIHAQSQRLVARPGDEVTAGRIGGAAARAVDESRRALAALTRPADTDLPAALGQSLDELASRYDVKVVADLDADAQGDGPMVEALLRIAGEAVRNAVRHGAAARIDVLLEASPLSLTLTDDGTGFPAHLPDGGRTGGFGLRSMRERAAGIGATLTVDSEPGKGTTVRVSWV